MPPKTRTAEDWIAFLLTCMENTPAKPDWNKVAVETGAYKSGKFVNQAYNNLRAKYGFLPTTNGSSSAPATPKSAKKRSAAAELPEDDDEKPKRARKSKTPKKEEPKEEIDNKKFNNVKVEGSEDELSGSVTMIDDE